jgi:DNA-binding Lrp family transcriptional regulator
MVHVEHHDDLAEFVAWKIQEVPGIETTKTLIAFQTYSQRLLEAGFDLGN